MIGKRLKELRTEYNLTQKEFASKFNMSDSRYNQYETGKRTPDYETLQLFADFFDVSTDYLLGRTTHRHVYLAGEDSTNSDKRENLASLSGDEIPEKLRDAGVGFIKLKEYIKKEGIPEEDVIKILEAIKQMKK